MKHEHNPIDPLFRENLRNYEVIPSEKSWEKIHANIDSKSERKIGIWMPLMAASISLLFFFSYVWMNGISTDTTANQNLAENATQPKTTRTAAKTIGQTSETNPEISNPKESLSELGSSSKAIQKVPKVPIVPPSHHNRNALVTSVTPSNLNRNAQVPQVAIVPPSNLNRNAVVAQVPQNAVNKHTGSSPNTPLQPISTDALVMQIDNNKTETHADQAIEHKIKTLAGSQIRAANKNQLVRIKSNITSADLMASLDDSDGSFPFSKKLFAIAEKKVIEVSKQIRIPENLSSIDQIEIIF